MKPHHAAALALVGWYLMMPSGDHPTEAHISHWLKVQTFDSAAECSSRRWDILSEASANKDDFRLRTARAMRCIASDDPRLKDK
jgi:hypothetical protein